MQFSTAAAAALVQSVIIALAGSLHGCSDAGLSGSSSSKKKPLPATQEPEQEKEPEVTKTAAETPPKVAKTPSEPEAQPDPTIARCLEDWSNHPFTAAELATPEFVSVDQSNANNGVIFRDDAATTKPRLVVISVISKNVNASKIQLLNPQGWYCVDIQSKAANNFRIETVCDAMIATLTHSEHVANGFAIDRVGCP